MATSRGRPKGALAPFGLGALVYALLPSGIGDQDMAALARQPDRSERARPHVIASPFGTIHAATYNFPRPVGTAMPRPVGIQLASLDPRGLDIDITGAIADTPLGERELDMEPAPKFPTVTRWLKGDRLASRPPPHAPVE